MLAVRALAHSPHGVKPLSELIGSEGEIQNFGAYSLCNFIHFVDVGIPFVKVENYNEDGIQWDSCRRITEDVHQLLWKSKLRLNDVLLSMAGSIGVSTVVRDDVEANSNQAIAKIRLGKHEVTEDFLSCFFNSEVGRKQSLRVSNGGVQLNINLGEIGTLLIPTPSPELQRRLVAALDAARGRRKKMLADADALLAGLDGFVLDQLGLSLPPPDGRMVYAARLRDARTRFDPDFHSPRFRTLRQKIEHGKHKPRTIKSLCDFIQSGFAAGGDDQTDDLSFGVPHIRPLNISNTAELHFDGTKMVPRAAVEPGDFLQQGEVLFNNTNSTVWVGKSVVFNADRECACSNHITRLRLAEKDDNPYFLAALLNALRGLGYFGLLATNFNNQAGVNADTLQGVRLPWPDGRVQTTIAAEVARRRAEARRLRADADTHWDQTKADFEAALLGSEPKAGKGGK